VTEATLHIGCHLERHMGFETLQADFETLKVWLSAFGLSLLFREPDVAGLIDPEAGRSDCLLM
jgi:hypothetical protein